MNTREKITEELIKVPADMLIDVLNIIIKEGLKHEILQIQENRSIAVIAVDPGGKEPGQEKVIENIHEIIGYYKDYRYSEQEHVNWRTH